MCFVAAGPSEQHLGAGDRQAELDARAASRCERLQQQLQQLEASSHLAANGKSALIFVGRVDISCAREILVSSLIVLIVLIDNIVSILIVLVSVSRSHCTDVRSCAHADGCRLLLLQFQGRVLWCMQMCS